MEQVISFNNIVITEHGRARLLERTKYKEKDMANVLINIWNNGHDESHYEGNKMLKKYLTNVRYNSGRDRSIRVKGNSVYIFNL